MKPQSILTAGLAALWLTASASCSAPPPPAPLPAQPTPETPTPGTTSPVGPGSTVPLPPAFEAASASSVVAKVKGLLTGLPPTSVEVAAVAATPKGADPGSLDQQALRGLIDIWMQTPQFQAKMLVFFRNAFQQNQVLAASMLDQLPSGIPNALLLQNLQDSFPLTAWQIVQSGQPFHQTLTTQTFMMTPALAALYAYLDDLQVNDSFTTSDTIAKSNPNFFFAVTRAHVPLSATLDPDNADHQYMFFYNATAIPTTVSAACQAEPRVWDHASTPLWSFLFGTLLANSAQAASAGGPCLQNVSVAATIAGTDYTTWRPVTIRQPQAGEKLTPFYDLLSMRGANEILLKIPRYGFLTPAFYANWQTNSSNQARVTMNQALIVALGKSFDGVDSTVPVVDTGLDAQHAGPGTACYSCHVTMDPMRQTLRQGLTLAYHEQVDPKQAAVPGTFAFDGVVKGLGGVGDLMGTMAQHPRFALAWAAKLCNWATSVPCDESDPELLRVAAVFQSAQFDFKTLMREVLSSPLVTAAADTQTFAQQGVTWSISRRDQLCAALGNRLGLTDPCGISDAQTFTAAQLALQTFANQMPADGYSRGAETSSVATDPSLFFRATTEDLCALFSDLVVDAGTGSRYVSTTAAGQGAAIADLVQTVMGLPPDDERAAPATQILTDHLQAATVSGSSPSNALKSTFMLACMSPGSTAQGL